MRWLRAGLVVVSLVGCRGGEPRGPEGQVVARVNETELTETELERLLPGELRGTDIQAEREGVIQQWVEAELLYQEARRQGLDRDPEIRRKVAEFSRMLLENEVLRRALDAQVKVTEEEVQAYYQDNREAFRRQADEVELSQIVVADSARAAAIRAELRLRPERFAEIARRESIDSSRLQGGNIGPYALEELSEPLRSVVATLKRHELSPVVHAPPFGYLLVTITGMKPKGSLRSLDEVRQEIRDTLFLEKEREARAALVAHLKARSRVEIPGP